MLQDCRTEQGLPVVSEGETKCAIIHTPQGSGSRVRQNQIPILAPHLVVLACGKELSSPEPQCDQL